MPLPVLLQADNFTPTARTPWGGTRITSLLKSQLAPQSVGEAWEFSVGPEFPSMTARSGDHPPRRLLELLEADPNGWLGSSASVQGHGPSLLVKLLDAADPLSVQIHPSDDDPHLGPNESGKPEAWYVVAAEPGAGVYLGLRDGTDERTLRRAIEDPHGQVHELLSFVPAEVGDFFVIAPGTPHAVGAGLTLLEPQRVLPGKRGVTYRYWDWNRRYDASGQPAAPPNGKSRPLQLTDALRVTRWDWPRGAEALGRMRVLDRPERGGKPALRHLCGPVGDAEPVSAGDTKGTQPSDALFSDALYIDRIAGTGTLPGVGPPLLRALTMLAGQASFHDQHGDVILTIPAGHTAAVPATFSGSVALENALGIFSAALPFLPGKVP